MVSSPLGVKSWLHRDKPGGGLSSCARLNCYDYKSPLIFEQDRVYLPGERLKRCLQSQRLRRCLAMEAPDPDRSFKAA